MSVPEADDLAGILEAILLVTDEPVSVETLTCVVDRPSGDIDTALRALADDYDAQRRGFALRNVGAGWRLFTRPAYAPYVQRFVLDGQSARLSQAALETLAVVAYRQPVTRAQVGAIRGVNVDGVVRTLLARGLIVAAGADPASGAGLYATTPLLLERLGVTTLAELPSLAPLLPEAGDLELDLTT